MPENRNLNIIRLYNFKSHMKVVCLKLNISRCRHVCNFVNVKVYVEYNIIGTSGIYLGTELYVWHLSWY
jgi:hypothetical protein